MTPSDFSELPPLQFLFDSSSSPTRYLRRMAFLNVRQFLHWTTGMGDPLDTTANSAAIAFPTSLLGQLPVPRFRLHHVRPYLNPECSDPSDFHSSFCEVPRMPCFCRSPHSELYCPVTLALHLVITYKQSDASCR